MGRLAGLTLRPTEFWNHSEKVGRQARFLNGEGPGLFCRVPTQRPPVRFIFWTTGRVGNRSGRIPLLRQGLPVAQSSSGLLVLRTFPASPLSL